MSMIAALLFLVEATAAACGPVAPAELTGRAEVVQAVLDFDEEAPELAAPTLAGVQSTGAEPADAVSNGSERDQAPASCRSVPMPIA